MESLAFALLLVALLAPAAMAANTSKIIFAHRDWEVRAVQWEGGSAACLAEVRSKTDVFSIFADNRSPMRLQFYSEKWNFGTSQRSTTLSFRIDSGPLWTVHNADLYGHSALFDLPKAQAGKDILSQVDSGRVLVLNDGHGKPVRHYSLAGAHQSLQALAGCVKQLR